MIAPARARSWQPVVVAGVCAYLFFFGLGAFGLVGADEPRYAQIGREMLARRDWITPTLNGIPWLEKPVLLYWQEMASYSIFGVHDWAARAPSALFALGLSLAMFFFARRFRPGTEMDAALITASSAAMIGFGRGASTDIQITAPFCGALLAWWTWLETGKNSWLAWFYGLLAVATLAKGPVAPGLAVLIVGAYALWQREPGIFLRSLWPPGFLLFFALALPWYVAVQIKVPEFFRTFFIEHNLERFGTSRYQHVQPFWYYLPVFLAGTLPWTVFVLAAIVEAGKNALHRFRGDGKDAPDGAESASVIGSLQPFLLIWIAVPMVLFSVSRSKLPGYILPAIPPAALLAADYLCRLRKASVRWMTPHALICGGLVAGALLAPSRMMKAGLPSGAAGQVAVAAALTAFAVLLMVLRGGPRLLRLATLFPVVLVLGFLLRPAAGVIDQVNSARSVDLRLRLLGVPPPSPVAVFKVKRDVEYGLNFYRNAPILRYERDGLPAASHVVIAAEGSLEAVRVVAGERQVSSLGAFPPQRLEFFLVGKAP